MSREKVTISKKDVGELKLPPDWKGHPDGTTRIVAAVGAMPGAGRLGGPPVADQIQAAMAQAVEQCAAEGIGMDQPDVIRARMLAARQAVIDEAAGG
jgi:hypothetical protein